MRWLSAVTWCLPTLNLPMWKNGISGIGPPLIFSKISPANGPCNCRRNISRPLGLFAVRGSSRAVTS